MDRNLVMDPNLAMVTSPSRLSKLLSGSVARANLKLAPGAGEAGFTLVASTIVVTAAIISVASLATFAWSNLTASRQPAPAKVARDAAISGINRIISELNISQNRRLLVNASVLASQSPATFNNDSRFVNPCARVRDRFIDTSNPIGNNLLHTIPARPTIAENQGSTFPVGTSSLVGTEIKIPGTANRLRYKLISISNGANSNEFNADGSPNPNFNVTVGRPGAAGTGLAGRSGTITLEVQGTYHDRGGAEISRRTVRRTLAIIPKCCGLPIGGYTGANNNPTLWAGGWAAVDSGTGTPTFDNVLDACPLAAGNAVIVGAGRRTSSPTTPDVGGSLAVSNLSQLLRRISTSGAETTATIRSLFCTVESANPTAADCPSAVQNTGGQTLLSVRNLAMPPVPTPGSVDPWLFEGMSFPVGCAGDFCGGGISDPSSFSSTPVLVTPRMRVCDANLRDGSWGDAATVRARADSVVGPGVPDSVISAGCNIVVGSTAAVGGTPPQHPRYVETLRTRDFDTWTTMGGYSAAELGNYNTGNTSGPFQNGNTIPADSGVHLKRRLGRICTRVSWPLHAAARVRDQTNFRSNQNVIYCSLSSLQLVNALINVDTRASAAGEGSIPLVLDFRNSLRTDVAPSTPSLLSGLSLIANPAVPDRATNEPVGIVQTNTSPDITGGTTMIPTTNPGDVTILGCGSESTSSTTICPAQSISTGYANTGGTPTVTTGNDFVLDGVFVYMPRGVVYSQGVQTLSNPLNTSTPGSYGYINQFNTAYPADPWAVGSVEVDPILPAFRNEDFCAGVGSGLRDCTNLRVRGVMWVNQILANAGISFEVPDYALARPADYQLIRTTSTPSTPFRMFSPLQWFLPETNWTPDVFTLEQDYAARSVISSVEF